MDAVAAPSVDTSQPVLAEADSRIKKVSWDLNLPYSYRLSTTLFYLWCQWTSVL